MLANVGVAVESSGASEKSGGGGSWGWFWLVIAGADRLDGASCNGAIGSGTVSEKNVLN